MRRVTARGVRRAVAVAVLVVPVVQVAAVPAARADDVGDAMVCLAPARRQVLVDAAVAAGVAESSSTAAGVVTKRHGSFPVEQWRARDPDGFKRACAAVVHAVRIETGGGGGGSASVWATLLPLLVGAALTLVTTFLTTGWRERLNEARRQGHVLRTAKAEFLQQVRDFTDRATDPRGAVPAADRLDAPRNRLLRALDETPDAGADAGLRRVRAAATTGVLGAGLTAQWGDRSQRDRASARYREIHEALVRLDSDVESGIRARQRPARTAIRRLGRRIVGKKAAG